MTSANSSGGGAPVVVGGHRGAPSEGLHLDDPEGLGGLLPLWVGLSEEERFAMWALDKRRIAYRDALNRYGVSS